MKSRSILVAFLVSLGVGSISNADKIYWSTHDDHRIFRSNADGTDPEIVVNNGLILNPSIGGVAVDPVGRKLYWSEARWIRRANLEIPDGETSSNRTDIENLIPVNMNPAAITLDLAARKVYWSTDGTCGGCGLFRGDMDGGEGELLVLPTNGAFNTSGLAVDIQQAGVPAVSDVGLAVLVLCLLAAGGTVIARRSRVAA